MMLAPQTISEKMRMKVMEVSTSDCVPEPVSPKVWEMIMAMTKLRTAASILVPKVFRIFLNTEAANMCINTTKLQQYLFPTAIYGKNFHAT